MNEPQPVSEQERRSLQPVFLSYATANRAEALKVCKAIERRGMPCWISMRDVPPGANYQEAIVQAIRDARAVVLIFSAAANDSDEIKKELSLASHHHVPVIALRTENVAPSDAFAYELSTRQWIDALNTKGRDRSIDLLVNRIRQISGAEPVSAALSPNPLASHAARLWRPAALASALGLAVLVMAGAWWWLRPAPAVAHSMTVRLAGFQLLSANLPATLRPTVDAEITAAFSADGVVGVSTASAPAPGNAPAYALGGTIQRDGPMIRVISHLTNERSGATLWSHTFNYDGKESGKVPRHIAVDAGNVVRCGLFGASTYRKALPDAVLRDYLQFCEGHWDPNMNEGRKALIPAQRVVAAVPDFSWGWAAVAGAYWKVAMNSENARSLAQARESGREAADRAVAIDNRNSEALYTKSMLLDPKDWTGRESLFKRALAARRLDCGCERHQYGAMLANVGRLTDAVEQLRLANDMLALYIYTPLSLAETLVIAGKAEEAGPFFDAAFQLAPDAGFADRIATVKATATGDLKPLFDPGSSMPAPLRTALLTGYRAVESGDAGAKAQAAQAIAALPDALQNESVAWLLASLGATKDALRIAGRLAAQDYPGPSVFWHPSMRAVLRDADFPAVAARLRLIDYWKTSGTRPDACSEARPAPFCGMI